MQLYYFQDLHGNFGDELNPWLWSRLAPELFDSEPGDLLIGIGTILDDQIPTEPNKIVFGSGFGYGRPPKIDERWYFSCVRGPMTAQALGLPAEIAITDPAMLVARFLPQSHRGRSHRLSFMPHHKTVSRAAAEGIDLRKLCEAAEVHFIDPGGAVDEVLSEIHSPECILAEAMHAAIVADALRVPWIPVTLFGHINDFKWNDWCSSLALGYEPVRLQVPTHGGVDARFIASLKNVPAAHASILSKSSDLERALARLEEKLDHVRHQFGRRADSVAWRNTKVVLTPQDLRAISVNANRELVRVQAAIARLAAVTERARSVLLVDQDEWSGIPRPGTLETTPFLERDRKYWGPPADDATAVRELERLKSEGADCIAFGWPAFWWLDHYAGFADYLQQTCRTILRSDSLVVFDLRSQP